MYAIIEESGAQRRIAQNDEIFIDLYQSGEAEAGSTITFDKVLLVGQPGGDASTAKIGTPYVAGASVTAEILVPLHKGEKLDIHKFRAKKGYKRKTGHRQRFTKVRITAINA